MSTAPLSSPVSVRLRHRGRDLVLTPGAHVLGRHKTCDIRLESTLVSRRHARVTVTRNGVLLEDLESANGVYVNGERIGTEVMRLHGGDRIVLGEEELEVQLQSHPISTSVPVSRSPLPPRPDPIVPYSESDVDLVDAEPSSPGTRTTDFFGLVGKIVERAIEEGRVEDAAIMLRSQLVRVLGDARSRRSIVDSARDGALKYALALARASGGGEWLDFALDLLTALCWAPDGELARDVELTISMAASVDENRLAQYVTCLEGTLDPRECLRVTYWARSLARNAARKSRSG